MIRLVLAWQCGEIEINEILLNSIPNIWIKLVYVKGFDCETIC